MLQIAKGKFKLYFTLFLIVIIYFIIWKYQCTTIINNVPVNKYKVPNIIHYIIFNQTKLNFINYLSILSALKIQKPETINIHTDSENIVGHYWKLLNNISTNMSIKLNYISPPTHVYGQPLSSIYHASDVTRIYTLKTNGGIYLDNDVLILNNLNGFRQYDMVVGCPDNESIGTQVLLASKDSKFLSLWLKGYQKYHPREWYFNAGKFPLMLIKLFPKMVHCEKELFGVQNLLDKLHGTKKWMDWKKYYTIHLLHRHAPSMKHVNEHIVQNLNTTFGDIVNWLLSL